MLDVLRSSAKGNVGKVIVGAIVVTFVLFGAESIISIAGNSAPATVNGDDISQVEFQRQMNNRQQELANQFGAETAAQLANSPFLREEVINTLINGLLQNQLARDLGLEVSDEMVINSFADIQAFQKDGKFDQNTYLNILASAGFNHTSFVASQKQQIALSQMQTGLLNSAFTVEKIANGYAELAAQQREVSFRTFAASEYRDQVVVTDDELQAYYDANQTEFLSEEQVKVDYILLSLQALADETLVTDAELQSAYDSFVVEYKANEVREVSHILFADGDQAAEAQAALDRLAAGEDFAALAEELSDDPGSAEFGGSLGELIPGIYVEAFYDAAVALQNPGDVSAPIETEFGTHLIKLDALQSVNVPSLAEKRDELSRDIQLRKARDEMLLVESQLADEAFASDLIADVADSFQTTVQTTDWLTRAGNSGVFANANVIAAVFSEQVIDSGLISEVIRLPNGDLLAAQKNEYQPEDVRSFDDVKADVEASVIAEKALELMQEDLAAVVAAKQIDDQWSTAQLVERNSGDLPGGVVEIAFQLAAPVSGSVSVGQVDNGNVAYAVAVSQVLDTAPDEELLEASKAYAEQIAGGAQYQMLFNQQRNSAKITVRQ